MPRKCIVCGAPQSTNSTLSFHCFPKNEELRNLWIKSCHLDSNELALTHSLVCSKHFKVDDYDSTYWPKRRLVQDAVPYPSNLHAQVNVVTPKLCSVSHPVVAEAISEQTELKCMQESQNIIDCISTTGEPLLNELQYEVRNPRYIGDLEVQDFGTPRRAKRNLEMVKNIADAQRKKIKNLVTENRRLAKQISTLKDLLFNLREMHLISEEAEETIMEATPDSIKSILERNLVSKNSKYSPELRSFALTLHFYSPKAYEYIRTSYNDLLPHPGTLQKWYQTMDGKPGFTLEAFEALALKVKEKQVIVNIAIDEMSIREQVQWDGNKYHGFVDLGTGLFSDSENTPKAKSVLVFMAVAVNSHWKVPLGYFLIKSLNASERKHLLEQCLSMLDKIAVDCRSITFDGAPVNIAMCNSLGSSFNLDDFRPWFCHPVSKKKVYTFWDPCHMLKLCRNALGHKKIFYTANGHQIHWKYLEQLAEEQNNRGLHLANKLTKRHINFQNEKMNVKLAAQTLSCSVSSALLFCKELGLPGFKYVDATAEFCCTINNIFDMLNSRNFLAKYIYKRPLSAKNLEFFSNACTSYIEYLRNLKGSDGILLIDSSRKVGFLGLIVCLENINCLYRDLITDTNIKFLLSYKLSQDHLEMFFSAVRSRGGYNNNPSAIQFSRAYKKLLVRHQISASKHSNCQILDATSILHVSSGSKKCIDDITNQTSEEISDEITLMLLNNDFNYFLPTLTEYDDNIITYIAGFVIKKIKTKIECNICTEQLYSNGDDLRLSNYTFVKLKNRGRLVMPSYDVVNVCKVSEKFLKSQAHVLFTKKNIKNFLSICILSETGDFFCNKLMINHLFSQNVLDNHRIQIIKLIINCYLTIRLHYEGKRKVTNENRLRQKCTKLILFRNE